MRVVVQRVSKAEVVVEGKTEGSIGKGVLLLLGIEERDQAEDVDWLCQKIHQLRIFDDAEGVMNLSLQDIQGELLIVSQFTLHAKMKKGNRPSWIRAARPEQAIPLYERFIQQMDQLLHTRVQTGVFGAKMAISLINDGPVTLLLDSQNKE